MANILSVLTRRLTLRRYSKLDNGFSLRLEEVSEGETTCTILLPSECGDGRPSDTEELLKPKYDPIPTTPPLVKAPPPQAQEPTKSQLKFEGFECDVSLEEDPSKRQEFSFTLYDFDGHGKITKDDIAGLVTTIYDTLGSSIRVPHYGSKTIKVKLTVSPDPSPTKVEEPQAPPQPRRYKRDLNVTIRERRRRPHRRRHSVSSSAASEDREADVSEEDEDPSPPSPHSRLGHNLHSTSCRFGASPGNLESRSKKRSSSLQRQELLQIIQANMEKNNLCFKTSRKQFSPEHDPSRHKNPQYFWDKSEVRGRGRGSSPLATPQRTMPTSPHHLKHRHREQEQARAMAQVVRWLEQQFSPPPPHKEKRRPAAAADRTEHHHIHEHVHHHYHHYQDTPVIV